MKREIFLVIVLIAAVTFITAGCVKKEVKQKEPADIQVVPLPPRETGGEASGPEAVAINFTETGNMVNWDSATETYTDTWRLLYDKPGNLAIHPELVFNGKSMCSIDGVQENCLEAINAKKITNGARVKVEGNISGGKVTVVNLQLISPGE